MTSYRQIEANRRNAQNSTGPKTEEGKQSSRCNAIRHGLTAETVIGALEDAEDYKAFEAAIIGDYNAQSAVERELVLRLASLLWRLRRSTSMETGLFEIQAQEIQAEYLRDYPRGPQLLSGPRHVIRTIFREPQAGADINDGAAAAFAFCFLRVANLSNFAFDRLNRYETMLWRQVGRILFTLDALDRRKPQERRRRHGFGSNRIMNDALAGFW